MANSSRQPLAADPMPDHRRGRWWPIALGVLWVACLMLPALPADRALANRDIEEFHVPLRTAFRTLAEVGLPLWNPWIHGGQPLLANLNYGALYPPSWLVFAVAPHRTLVWLAVLHLGLAFAGAWRLTRHLGASRGVAALAGIGFAGCGAYLSLLSSYSNLLSASWLPWTLLWTDRTLGAGAGRLWIRPALAAAGCFAMQLLCGDPTTAVVSGLFLLAMAGERCLRRELESASRVVPIVALACGFAAVQLLPTASRLLESGRRDLDPETATFWSLPPARLVEMAFPRFFGDPGDGTGYYVGSAIHDRGYPYIVSIYPGLALLVLGLAAVFARRIPRRWVWSVAMIGGLLLAMGRHSPGWELASQLIPGLSFFRYPEKFVLLTVLAVVVAGVLAWQHLLDERDQGRPESARMPRALSLAVLALAAVFSAFLHLRPELVEVLYVDAEGKLPIQPWQAWPEVLGYLRSQSLVTVAMAGAVSLLLRLCATSAVSRRQLEILAVLLVAADLWVFNRSLIETTSANKFVTPAPLVRRLQAADGRVWIQPTKNWQVNALNEARDDVAANTTASLEILTGISWGIGYAGEGDFDLTLTPSAQAVEATLALEAAEPDLQSLYRYLGVWNVGTLLLRMKPEEQVTWLRDPNQPPVRVVPNTYVLPRYRFVPEVVEHADFAAAKAAARQAEWTVGRTEHWITPDGPRARPRRPPPLLLAPIEDVGSTIRLRYRAEDGAYFVAAVTYDAGWRALVDQVATPVHPTAAGQMGLDLPAGEHELVLQFREPKLGAGVLISLFTLAAAAGLVKVSRRFSAGPAAGTTAPPP